MKTASVIFGAVAFMLPLFALAANSQLVVTTQTDSGSSLPSGSATVTVYGNGVSLSGSPAGGSSVSYLTNFNNSQQTVAMNPDSYHVDVSGLSDYTYSYSASCSGYANNDTTQYCAITARRTGYGSGTAALTVYVNIDNSGGYNYNQYSNYQPSDFRINVSGSSPSPSSFYGSRNGTYVSLGTGSYSVNPQSQTGWTYGVSGDCSGTMYGSDNRSCTVTYHPTGSPYCDQNVYNNQYGYNDCNNTYPYQGQLSCYPSSQTVGLNQNVVITATGGTGSYAWTSGSYTYSGNGATLTAQFYSPGPQTVVVTSGGQTEACTVNVIANGYVTPGPSYPYSGNYPGGYPAYRPKLPNTGFAPVSAWQYALAASLLALMGWLSYPYVRNALSKVGR